MAIPPMTHTTMMEAIAPVLRPDSAFTDEAEVEDKFEVEFEAEVGVEADEVSVEVGDDTEVEVEE
jgi:hypothetical protein